MTTKANTNPRAAQHKAVADRDGLEADHRQEKPEGDDGGKTGTLNGRQDRAQCPALRLLAISDLFDIRSAKQALRQEDQSDRQNEKAATSL